MSHIEVYQFPFDGENQSKTVSFYLPENWDCANKTIPLLVMHDGHNLFFKSQSAFGETWKVKETLDELYQTTNQQLFVIGIAAPSIARFDEYSPFPLSCDPRYLSFQPDHLPGGKGNDYLKWIRLVILPFFLSKYPIDSKRIYMAGSSMGGFISLYAGYKYPNVFSKIGVFSPALWFADNAMISFIDKNHNRNTGIYLDIGTNETSNPQVSDFPDIYLSKARQLYQLLKRKNTANLCYVEEAGGTHSEIAWARRFPRFCQWLFESNK
ncbi:MAG: alpha/beta hydrolase-fold protein [Candidatus Izemoplasmatales bacterium]|nr:alpha/beta hydrolase-fold protein [Candidatus Izemoplasmatales bacterium]